MPAKTTSVQRKRQILVEMSVVRARGGIRLPQDQAAS
jgi:hypothetical protein